MNNLNKIESVDQIEFAKEFASKKFEEIGVGNHFLEVYQILQDEFNIFDQNVLVAALLHDTLEDTNTTYEEIEKTFSKEIADLVQEVSHPKNYNSEQKKEYYESLKHVSSGAKMIKLADFTSHLRKFIGAFTGTSDYPKFTHNEYCVFIRSFLESCEDSDAKNLVFNLTNELDSYIANNK
jgi:(p)ppGpp synthase/HD superfamily hydrolase